MPRLRAGVHLVPQRVTHLWNRFRNPQACAAGDLQRGQLVRGGPPAYPAGYARPPGYAAQGDPGGLTPIVPTVAPLRDEAGRPLPYLASNDITAFSILDSAAGVVRSYRFDTREPQAGPVLFDEFALA